MDASPQFAATPLDHLRDLLREAAAPVPVKQLQAATGLKPKPWKALAQEALAQGVAKLWPKQRYWHLSPDEATAARIPTVLAALQAAPAPVTESELATALGLAAADLKPALKAALAQSGVKKWPKSRYWHLAEQDAVRSHLLEALRSGALPASHVDRATPPYSSAKVAVKVLKAMLASGAVALAYTLPAPDPAVELLAALQRLQRGPGVPVSVRELRAAVALEKADFDRAALALADRQQVYLTTHDHGWALSDADRAPLIHDGGTKLYAAVTLRD